MRALCLSLFVRVLCVCDRACEKKERERQSDREKEIPIFELLCDTQQKHLYMHTLYICMYICMMYLCPYLCIWVPVYVTLD